MEVTLVVVEVGTLEVIVADEEVFTTSVLLSLVDGSVTGIDGAGTLVSTGVLTGGTSEVAAIEVAGGAGTGTVGVSTGVTEVVVRTVVTEVEPTMATEVVVDSTAEEEPEGGQVVG